MPADTPPMSESELDELRRLEAAATPEPWEREENEVFVWTKDKLGTPDCYVIYDNYSEADAAFIAALRNAAPRLLATLDAQAARISDLGKELRGTEQERDDLQARLNAYESILVLTDPVPFGLPDSEVPIQKPTSLTALLDTIAALRMELERTKEAIDMIRKAYDDKDVHTGEFLRVVRAALSAASAAPSTPPAPAGP